MPHPPRRPRSLAKLADPRRRGGGPFRRGALLVALLLGLAAPVRADETDASLWATAQLNFPITERFGAGLLVQPRIRDKISELQLVVVRPSLELTLVPDLARVAVGYDAIQTQRSNSNLEQRAWQQLSLRRQWDSLAANLRLRLEERFFDDSDAVGLRSRIRLDVRVPVTKRLDLWLHNESFVTMKDTSEGPSTGYDENRAFGGLGYRVTERLGLEVGYQNVYLERRGRNLINHTLRLGFSLTTPTLFGGD